MSQVQPKGKKKSQELRTKGKYDLRSKEQNTEKQIESNSHAAAEAPHHRAVGQGAVLPPPPIRPPRVPPWPSSHPGPHRQAGGWLCPRVQDTLLWLGGSFPWWPSTVSVAWVRAGQPRAGGGGRSRRGGDQIALLRGSFPAPVWERSPRQGSCVRLSGPSGWRLAAPGRRGSGGCVLSQPQVGGQSQPFPGTGRGPETQPCLVSSWNPKPTACSST